LILIYFSLLYSATAGDLTALKRFHFSGVNMSNANYDGRTALHLAAAEGHASCVKFLVESCKLNPLAKDRFVHGISLILPVSLGLSILYFGTLVGWCDINFDLLLYTIHSITFKIFSATGASNGRLIK
jgi:ankyrin repeat protein